MTSRLLPVGVFVALFRESLESDPFYSDLWLEGDVSDFSRSPAGHIYFNLRDDDGCLKCVLFRRQALRQPLLPGLGERVAVHGGLSVYPRSGAIQLQVDLVRPAGLGVASLELEYLRHRLASEGLFDPLRKRPLPPWPKTIGVVTSAHGAAWHDIQTVISRRYPLATLVLCSTPVQGDAAPAGIVEALHAVQRVASLDVIIVARGGGDHDDLAAFNEESVVRAVFASRVPVIVGVGHATDRTLVEEVADVVAPTPSAAAEMCVPSMAQLSTQILSLGARLRWGMSDRRATALSAASKHGERLRSLSPALQVVAQQGAVTAGGGRLHSAATAGVSDRLRDVQTAGTVLAALNPDAVLRRGYASIQHAADGASVFSMSQVARGDRVIAFLRDGSFGAVVERAGMRSRTDEPRR
jgi:exodeoxyribonuclease VII large subunit